MPIKQSHPLINNQSILNIYCWFSPIYMYTDVCNHCILSTYLSSVEKNHRHITRLGFEPLTFAMLEQWVKPKIYILYSPCNLNNQSILGQSCESPKAYLQ